VIVQFTVKAAVSRKFAMVDHGREARVILHCRPSQELPNPPAIRRLQAHHLQFLGSDQGPDIGLPPRRIFDLSEWKGLLGAAPPRMENVHVKTGGHAVDLGEQVRAAQFK
jgi:hypothetical protein